MRRRRGLWRRPQSLATAAVLVMSCWIGLQALALLPKHGAVILDVVGLVGNKEDGGFLARHLLQEDQTEPTDASVLVTPPTNGTGNKTKEDPLFPPELFTDEELRQGAVALHVIGVAYMFVALAIVCDEFFVPSLDVIIEKLDITEDVAGATFMAAGGSAPELFTSVIGVFVSFSDVGIGTIVGSAVFNILFVIGMCALFSKTVLHLTWWPLFRDCSFYSISLLALVGFFLDSHIQWWEASLLLGLYALYVVFMKFNQQVERAIKSHVNRNKVTRVRSTDQLVPNHQTAAQVLHGAPSSSSQSSVNGPGGGPPPPGLGGAMPGGTAGTAMGIAAGVAASPGLFPGSSNHHHHHPHGPVFHSGTKFRHGLLQLMIHSIDPMHDGEGGKVDEKATQLHAIASLKVLLDATRPQNGAVKSHLAPTTPPPPLTAVQCAAAEGATTEIAVGLPHSKETQLGGGRQPSTQGQPNGALPPGAEEDSDDDEEDNGPLDISWPETCRKRITYLLLIPIVIPLWLTLPDPRSPRGKRFFPITFIGSILWIAGYSYLMVWWSTTIGNVLGIPPEVMGLTFLAAGTSIPDLITSVIVARKGLGDMAVSSSIGSNIFDVCVGLPLPWLLYTLIFGKAVEVSSQGMACSIVILFCMLLFVIMSIMCFNWKMNKGLGVSMFLLYFVFVAVSLSFEYDYIHCPV